MLRFLFVSITLTIINGCVSKKYGKHFSNTTSSLSSYQKPLMDETTHAMASINNNIDDSRKPETSIEQPVLVDQPILFAKPDLS